MEWRLSCTNPSIGDLTLVITVHDGVRRSGGTVMTENQHWNRDSIKTPRFPFQCSNIYIYGIECRHFLFQAFLAFNVSASPLWTKWCHWKCPKRSREFSGHLQCYSFFPCLDKKGTYHFMKFLQHKLMFIKFNYEKLLVIGYLQAQWWPNCHKECIMELAIELSMMQIP